MVLDEPGSKSPFIGGGGGGEALQGGSSSKVVVDGSSSSLPHHDDAIEVLKKRLEGEFGSWGYHLRVSSLGFPSSSSSSSPYYYYYYYYYHLLSPYISLSSFSSNPIIPIQCIYQCGSSLVLWGWGDKGDVMDRFANYLTAYGAIMDIQCDSPTITIGKARR